MPTSTQKTAKKSREAAGDENLLPHFAFAADAGQAIARADFYERVNSVFDGRGGAHKD